MHQQRNAPVSGDERQCGWRLRDAQVIADRYPYTFWKPSVQLVALLKPGDGVKLIFDLVAPSEEEPSGERMWLEIIQRNEDSFIGRLDSQPRHIADLPRGSIVSFGPAHIIDSSLDDPVPDSTLKWQPRCVVTNRIIKHGEKVGFLFREASDRPRDSGWRFSCGTESQDYMDDAKNLRVVSLGAVLRVDDRIVSLLDQPAPIAFEWDEGSQRFIPTTMPELE